MTKSLEHINSMAKATSGDFFVDDTPTVPIERIELDPADLTPGQKIETAVSVLAQAANDRGVVYSDGSTQLGSIDSAHLVTENDATVVLANPEPGAKTFILVSPKTNPEDGTVLGLKIVAEMPGFGQRQETFPQSNNAPLTEDARLLALDCGEAIVGTAKALYQNELISPDTLTQIKHLFEQPEISQEQTMPQRIHKFLNRAAAWAGFGNQVHAA